MNHVEQFKNERTIMARVVVRCIINPGYVEGVEGVEECQGESEGVEDSRG